jgi:hypothetical protein
MSLCYKCGQEHSSTVCPQSFLSVSSQAYGTEPSAIEIKLDRIIQLLERQNSELESIRMKLKGGG